MKRMLSLLLVLVMVCSSALAEDEPGFFESFGKRLDSFFTGAGDAISGAWDAACEAVSSAAQSVGEAVSGAWQSVAGFTVERYSAIRDYFTGQYREFKEKWDESAAAYESSVRFNNLASGLRPYYEATGVKAGLSEEAAKAQWDTLIDFARENGLDMMNVYIVAGSGLLNAYYEDAAQDYDPVAWMTERGLTDPALLNELAQELAIPEAKEPAQASEEASEEEPVEESAEGAAR